MEKIYTEEDLRFAINFTKMVENFKIINAKTLKTKKEFEEILNLKKTLDNLKQTKCPMNKPLCLILDDILKEIE